MLPEKTWRLDAVLRLILAIMVAISLGGLCYELLHERVGPGNEKLLSFAIGAVFFQGATLLLIQLFLREHQTGWVSGFGIQRRSLGWALLWGIGVTVVALPGAWILAQLSATLITQSGFEPAEQPAVQTLRSTVSPLAQVFFGVIAIGVAPCVEEALFRGILYPALKRLTRPAIALWSTSILFALFHVSAVTFVPLTFLALMLTLSYERTGNLASPIVTHCLFNAANYYWLLRERPF